MSENLNAIAPAVSIAESEQASPADLEAMAPPSRILRVIDVILDVFQEKYNAGTVNGTDFAENIHMLDTLVRRFVLNSFQLSLQFSDRLKAAVNDTLMMISDLRLELEAAAVARHIDVQEESEHILENQEALEEELEMQVPEAGTHRIKCCCSI